jgi:hypothetical protein
VTYLQHGGWHVLNVKERRPGERKKDKVGNPMKTKDVDSRGTKDSNTRRFKRGERMSRKTTRTWEEEWKAK